MTRAWEATPERPCPKCLRWVPALSIDPRYLQCHECIHGAEGERRRGDGGHLPPTARQVETLRAVARTGGYQEAASALGVSVNTVSNAMSMLYRRIGVNTLPEAFYTLWLRDLWGET